MNVVLDLLMMKSWENWFYRIMYLEAYNNQKQSEISKRKSLSISMF